MWKGSKVFHFLSEHMLYRCYYNYIVYKKLNGMVLCLKKSYMNRNIFKILLLHAGLLKFGVVQRLLLEKESDVKRQRSSTEKVSIECSNTFKCHKKCDC